MSDTDPPERPEIPQRGDLAARLRGLRLDAGLSTTALADRLGWSQSRVSRVERGATLATAEDVDAWTDATGADPDTRRQLAELADLAHVRLVDWKREMAPGRRRKQQEIGEHEAQASVVREFSGEVIPGLAQTRATAAAMFRLGMDTTGDARVDAEDLDAILDARMERQALLDTLPATGKRVELIMSETALWLRRTSKSEHRAQLAHLIEVSRLPGVRLAVIPFDPGRVPGAPGETAHQYHAYTVFGDPDADVSALVLVETVTRGLRIRAAADIAEYVGHFRRLDAAALHDDDARDLIREVSQQIT